MKRWSSVRLTEAPSAVTPILSLPWDGVEASLLFGRLRRGGGAHFARALSDRFHDIVVAGAAADIAFEAVADRVFVKVRAQSIDEVDGGHDHARRAEAALQPVIVLESLLHGMELAVRGEAFDRRHLRALATRRQHRA